MCTFGGANRALSNGGGPIFLRSKHNAVFKCLKFESFAVLGPVKVVLKPLSNLEHFDVEDSWDQRSSFKQVNNSSSGCDAVMRVEFFCNVNDSFVKSKCWSRIRFKFDLETNRSFQQVGQKDCCTIFDGLDKILA